MEKVTVGGQALIEGVMMLSPSKMAVAVRKPDGTIYVSSEDRPDTQSIAKWKKLPFMRGCVAMVDSLSLGMKTITKSAEIAMPEETEEPSRFEKWLAKKTNKKVEDIVIPFAVVVAVLLSVGLFIVLPTLVSGWMRPLFGHWLWANLFEGLLRIIIFMGYIILIARMPDIARVFMYHGAEHKLVAAYEKTGAADIETAKTCSRLHPRCGTSFMFLVVFISILVFSLVGRFENIFIKVLVRLALLPVVAGISYEALRFLAKHEGAVARALRWPGLQLQRLTTREPDDSMLEVAAASLNAALGVEYEPEIAATSCDEVEPCTNCECQNGDGVDS